jgi:hypothetical protein
MALKANATMTFIRYDVLDGGILLVFTCPDPGPGENSEWPVVVTDAELGGVSNQVQLRNLVQTKLERRYRAVTVANRLDPFIGQSLTI